MNFIACVRRIFSRRVGAARVLGVAALALCVAAGPVWAAAPVGVSHPWFRFLLPTLPAGGYMTLTNATGRPVRLIGAKSPACGMAMLHRTVDVKGMEKMVPVKSITIPAHGKFSFSPGYYHVMCMQPKMKPGATVPVTLKFRHLPPLTVRFAVYGARGRPAGK